MQEIGARLLAAAEAGEKADSLYMEAYGPAYLYDAERLRRLLGKLFAPRLPAVVSLCAALRWGRHLIAWDVSLTVLDLYWSDGNQPRVGKPDVIERGILDLGI